MADVAGVSRTPSPTLPTGAWEAQLLNVEETAYVGPDLSPLLGVIALANDAEGHYGNPSPNPTFSSAIPALPPAPHTDAPPYDTAPHNHVEAQRAVTDLRDATCEVWVLEGTPEERGYNARPKKGKPLPRAPIRRRIEG